MPCLLLYHPRPKDEPAPRHVPQAPAEGREVSSQSEEPGGSAGSGLYMVNTLTKW